ncbi:MAG: hypothetical protein E5W60_08465, partial [Mesorhizobium sp.]
LQLVKQLQQIAGKETSAVNTAYGGSVNVASLLSALTSQASQGVTQREQSLQSASGQIGQSDDVKGSVDQNTRMQLENARAVNELIGVQNGAVAALNEKLKTDLAGVHSGWARRGTFWLRKPRTESAVWAFGVYRKGRMRPAQTRQCFAVR